MRALSLFFAILFGSSVAAQSFPVKPPRLYVGFVPGGGVDQTARITTTKLTEIWGQPITVENKTGAGGTIAADAAAKSAPDGYTLILCNGASHGIGPSLYRKLPYDAVKDVTYIGLIGTTANVMAVHPSVPATTVGRVHRPRQGKPRKAQLRFLRRWHHHAPRRGALPLANRD